MSQVSSTSDMLLYVIAIFIPTLPVFMKVGCGSQVIINICLWILGWIPGVIHAWWIIGKNTTPRGMSTASRPVVGTSGGTYGTTGTTAGGRY